MNNEIEIWKPIASNPYYFISSMGRVKSIDHPIWCKVNNSYSIRKGHLLKANNSNSKHYWRIRIPNGKRRGKMRAVHRLVAEAFLPNPNNLPQINHKDGNKSNNCVDNLEWCDNGYNQKHAVIAGLKSRPKMSSNCHLRKLTEEEVLFIKEEFEKRVFIKRGDKMRFCEEMKQKFNLRSRNTIFWIIQGGTNKYINVTPINSTKS